MPSMLNECKQEGIPDTRENAWEFFINKVRRNLKVRNSISLIKVYISHWESVGSKCLVKHLNYYAFFKEIYKLVLWGLMKMFSLHNHSKIVLSVVIEKSYVNFIIVLKKVFIQGSCDF